MANTSIHKFGEGPVFPQPLIGTKRQRDLNPPSLASPKFDPMKIFRQSVAYKRNRDADSPAPKIRKRESPKSTNRESSKSRNRESPKSRNRESPKSRNRESPKSRNRESPKTRNRESPKSRNRESPKIKKRESPRIRKRESPKIKTEPGLIRIKSEKQLLETSSDSSDSDSSDEGKLKSEPYSTSPPSSGSSRCRSTKYRCWKTGSLSPKWRSFGSDVQFTSTPSSSSRRVNQLAPNGPPPFCFHCKRFGHDKQVCNFPWHYWWPQEMLNRHPWIRRRVRELRPVHLSRHPQYHRLALNLDREVEAAEKRKVSQEHRSYGKPRYYEQPVPMSPRGRTLFQPNGKSIEAHNKFKSPSKSTASPKKELMQSMQDQINNLQLALSKLRNQSVPRPC